MNIEETERLIATMRLHGVSHFKSAEVEVRMHQAVNPVFEKLTLPEVPASESKPKESTKTAASAPPVEITIPHHVNEVANLLKLDDHALVDKLFPDYTQMEPKE